MKRNIETIREEMEKVTAESGKKNFEEWATKFGYEFNSFYQLVYRNPELEKYINRKKADSSKSPDKRVKEKRLTVHIKDAIVDRLKLDILRLKKEGKEIYLQDLVDDILDKYLKRREKKNEILK